MRSVILLPPPASALDSVPACFSDPVDEPSVREWLSHPAARRRLSLIDPKSRFDDAVCRTFRLSDHSDAVLVVYVAGFSIVGETEWAELGLAPKSPGGDDVEARVADGNAALARGDYRAASNHLTEARELLGNERSDRHARILCALGEIARHEGRPVEAAELLDQALLLSPANPDVLTARVAIARSTGDPSTAAAMLHRSVSAQGSRTARIEVLRAAAEESLAAARLALEQALVLEPHNRDLLERLIAACEAAGDWSAVVSVSVDRAEKMVDREERARALVAAARFCADRTGNTSRAVALYEAAIEDDPEVDGAFAAIEKMLRRRGDAAELAKAYERQLERLDAKNADKEERASLLERLANLQATELGELAAAVRSFDRLVGLRPDDAHARARIADLLERLGEPTVAIRTLEIAVEYRPFDAELYRRLARLARATEDAERTFSASAVLVALGEANPEERLEYSRSAPQAPGGFERSFDEDVWIELAPPEHPALVDRFMTALDKAAVQSWVDGAEARGLSTLPPEQQRIDPRTSTISAVKSFQWASRLLGVPEPSLYAQPQNAAIGVATVRARTPVILLGRPVLSGRSAVELAFLATRHLTYLRPGYRLLSFYPTEDELATLIRAAIAVARSEHWDESPSSLDANGQRLAIRLNKNLDADGLSELRQVVADIHAHGGSIDLLSWARSAETIACRAALLAAGDITVALTLLGVAGGPSAGLTARQRSADLSAFSVSERYLALRRLLGLGATA